MNTNNDKTQVIQTLELSNVYSCNNIGDAAIYASLIDMAESFAVYWPANQFDVGTNNQQVGCTGVAHNPYLSMDARLSVGGDIFNNARQKLITKTFLSNLYQLMVCPSATALFGQSIPRSCHGISFYCLAKVLRNVASVTVRDVESYQRLSQAGVNAKLSYDAVLSQSPSESLLEQVRGIMAANVDFKETALLSLRPFDAMYAYNTDRCIEQLVICCQKLSQSGYVPTFMHHAKVDHKDGDAAMIEHIGQRTPIKVIDPFALAPDLVPWQFAMAVTAMAELVIGIRYHTSIFRLAAGKMPFNLYYSNKGEDLCNRLLVPGMAIADFDAEKHIELVIETSGMTFDNLSVAQQVRADFEQAMAVATAYQSTNDILNGLCDA